MNVNCVVPCGDPEIIECYQKRKRNKEPIWMWSMKLLFTILDTLQNKRTHTLAWKFPEMIVLLYIKTGQNILHLKHTRCVI